MTNDNIIDLAAPYGRKKDGTPKKPRGFQRGGAEYRAPSGTPAGGFIASPPKGENRPVSALMPGAMTPEKRALGEASRLNQEIAAEEARQLMYTIMHDTSAGAATQLQAADKLLNRIEGAPVARVINATLDDIQRMKDDELAAELEAVRRKGTAPSA